MLEIRIKVPWNAIFKSSIKKDQPKAIAFRGGGVTFLPVFAGLEPVLNKFGIRLLEPDLGAFAGTSDRNAGASHGHWVLGSLHPRIIAVFDEFADLVGVWVLVVE